jgi:hypothetical protein
MVSSQASSQRLRGKKQRWITRVKGEKLKRTFVSDYAATELARAS